MAQEALAKRLFSIKHLSSEANATDAGASLRQHPGQFTSQCARELANEGQRVPARGKRSRLGRRASPAACRAATARDRLRKSKGAARSRAADGCAGGPRCSEAPPPLLPQFSPPLSPPAQAWEVVRSLEWCLKRERKRRHCTSKCLSRKTQCN
eukprot:2568379-Pleurochrysis_carterae.AAC.2